MLQDLFNYLYHQTPTGGIPLRGTGIVVGLLLIVSHLAAWLGGDKVKSWLVKFPREYFPGLVMLTVALAWAMLCLNHMDMGEFFFLRPKLLIAAPIAYVLMLVYVPEFLSVRALGCLMLLAAGPVLEAAFLQPQMSRLLLPALAYVWIIAGMYFVGMPFLLRDAIKWVLAHDLRWKAATLGGVAYGTLLVTVALLWW
jgi:hypothetical protein